MTEQQKQIQIQVKEVAFTTQEITNIDAIVNELPYKIAKPIYDIINGAITRTVNALAKDEQEKQAALKVVKEPAPTTAEE